MTPLEPPLVVKVGGSLFDRVAPLLEIFREVGRPVLIVPGGGKFAELVRRLAVSDTAAHWMAISGMEQFACISPRTASRRPPFSSARPR